MLGLKMGLRLYSFGTETTFRQTKHSTFEFTTVNKDLFAVAPQRKNIGGEMTSSSMASLEIATNIRWIHTT